MISSTVGAACDRAVTDRAYSSGNFEFRYRNESAMYLGKVIGRVVCSVKNDVLQGKKLLLVRRLPHGTTVVAIDAVGAGAGETVYVCRGREAAFAFKPEEVPTEAAIVAIVYRIQGDNIEAGSWRNG